jgi:hypothetical protein
MNFSLTNVVGECYTYRNIANPPSPRRSPTPETRKRPNGSILKTASFTKKTVEKTIEKTSEKIGERVGEKPVEALKKKRNSEVNEKMGEKGEKGDKGETSEEGEGWRRLGLEVRVRVRVKP